MLLPVFKTHELMVLFVSGLLACGSCADPKRSANATIAQLPTTARLPDQSAARRVRCGNVIAADHPAFAAIRKLATSRNEVRVLVYGQSISQQAWWSKTKSWLQLTYPGAQLVMEEHAHGGCAAQCLIGHEAWSIDGSQINRLPQDVFAWHPDLIIFHVTGDHVDYGYIMKAFKLGCAAFDDYRTHDGKDVDAVHCTPEQRALSRSYRAPEVLVQNDFIAARTPVACPDDPTPSTWNCFMNEKVIPENVRQYGYTLQDNFHLWPSYIVSHHIDPLTLLKPDLTHLSEPIGTEVMFAFTVPHLCYGAQREL
jgi:hypothetical protein